MTGYLVSMKMKQSGILYQDRMDLLYPFSVAIMPNVAPVESISPASGSRATLHTTPPVGLKPYKVVFKISNDSSMNWLEGLKVAVENTQFLPFPSVPL